MGAKEVSYHGRLKILEFGGISREECEDEGRCEIYFSKRILCSE